MNFKIIICLLWISLFNVCLAKNCNQFHQKSKSFPSYNNKSIFKYSVSNHYKQSDVEKLYQKMLERNITDIQITIDADGKYTSFFNDENIKLIPRNLLNDIIKIHMNLINKMKLNNKYRLYKSGLDFRMTSDTYGFAVNTKSQGTKNSGLHDHSTEIIETGQKALDYTLALKGKGSIYKSGKNILEANEGEILIFGQKVLHGSPIRKEPTLIIIGDILMSNEK